jgi:hypothetical protein
MNDCDCFKLNPLKRGGTQADKKGVAALSPSFALLDDRTLSDFILFAENYSGLINFYNSTNNIQGDWKNFITNDLTTIIAGIIETECEDADDTFALYSDKLFQTSDPALIKKNVKILFNISFSIILIINKWNERLILQSPTKVLLIEEITSKLKFDFRDLIAYYKTCIHHDISETITINSENEEFNFFDTNNIIDINFTNEWWVRDGTSVPNNWITYRDSINPNDEVVGNISWNTKSQSDYFYSFLKKTYDNIYNSYVRIVEVSKDHLEKSMNEFAWHKAPNAIMLSFLKLFGIAIDELNNFSDRHLNFYYKDVLRIDRKPANNDSVHVVFTPSKNVDYHIVPGKTKLLAGNDKIGREIIYLTDDDIVVNQSSIEEIRTVLIEPDQTSAVLIPGKIYAAPIANSMDGIGKELSKENPAWNAFGEKQRVIANRHISESMHFTSVGFAIATPILQLSEGLRIITLNFNCTSIGSGTLTEIFSNSLKVFITGKKGWIQSQDLGLAAIDPNKNTENNAFNIDLTANIISIQFSIGASTDEIINYDSKIHGENYLTSWPVVKVLLNQENQYSQYNYLKNCIVSSIDVFVNVVGAKHCVLHTATGPVDANTPFMPFGPRPKIHSSFYFGNTEVFSKKIDDLKINIEWLGLPTGTLKDHYNYNDSNSTLGITNYLNISDDSDFKIDINVLEDGSFRKSKADVALFDPNSFNSISDIYTASDPSLGSFENFNVNIKRGFIEFVLINPPDAFGHEVFGNKYAIQTIIKTTGTDSEKIENDLPNPPYTPLIKSITYDYSGSENIPLNTSTNKSLYDFNKGQLFRIYPFGTKEITLINSSLIEILSDQTIHPIKKTIIGDLQGALYLGVKNIFPRQVLSLYFQLAEGTEDASIDPTAIGWSYLSKNEWLPFGKNLLSDTTNGMLGSGIVKLNIPDEMNDDNTLMSSGLRWLRIGVAKSLIETNLSIEAYPKMLDVFTNGVKATFVNIENDPGHLEKPLAPDAISKLYFAETEIKKIFQPYESYNGRSIEESEKYYGRVSERLRHKNRAITIWDYEHLILEEFNFLFRTKCLNHTNECTEIAPGFVRIVVVPDIRHRKSGNLLTPVISNNNRQRIKNYITALNCPFVDTEIQNPEYFRIRVNCGIKFKEQYNDENAYKNLSAEAIKKFLAPWAFNSSKSIDFGGSIHRSQIVKLLEDLYYVDYVTGVTLDVFDSSNKIQATDQEEITADRSNIILTSFENHNLDKLICVD